MAASPRPLMPAAPTELTIQPRSLAVQLDRALGKTLETITALLVAAEVVILFVGIVARYVFHSPLIWSDELASALFLWLAMLGSVVALRLGGHMRMTAFVNRASPCNRGKITGTAAFFSCADSSPWTLCIMCRRRPPFPR